MPHAALLSSRCPATKPRKTWSWFTSPRPCQIQEQDKRFLDMHSKANFTVVISTGGVQENVCWLCTAAWVALHLSAGCHATSVSFMCSRYMSPIHTWLHDELPVNLFGLWHTFVVRTVLPPNRWGKEAQIRLVEKAWKIPKDWFLCWASDQ